MSACLWKVAVGMALFGFVATLEVSAAVAKEPTAITDQTKSFEGLDRERDFAETSGCDGSFEGRAIYFETVD